MTPASPPAPPPASALERILQRRWLVYGILLCLPLALYLNTFLNEFLYDEVDQILTNRWVTEPGHFFDILTKGIWEFQDNPLNTYYRPFFHLFNRIVYALFGAGTFGFHLGKLALHVLNTFLVFFLLREVTARDGRFSDFARSFAPLLAACLFAAHPINTEAVAFMSASMELLYTALCLLSALWYARALGKGGASESLSYGSWAAFGAALLSKEPALLLPLLLAALDLTLAGRPSTREGWTRFALRLLPYILIAGVYLLLRKAILSSSIPTASIVAPRSLADALSRSLILAAWAVAKLLFPVGLNMYPALPDPGTLTAFPVIAAVLVLAAAVVAAWAALKKLPCAGLALTLLAFTLPTALYLFVFTLGAGERYLYFPSVGLCFLLALVALKLLEGFPRRATPLLLVLALLLGVYAAATALRNTVFRDERTLWTDTMEKSPGALLPRFRLGLELVRRGEPDRALAVLGDARRMPGEEVSLSELCYAMFEDKRYPQAAACYELHLASRPDDPDALVMLGVTRLTLNRFAEAVESFTRADRLFNFSHPSPKRGLGLAYERLGRPEQALEFLREALRLDPSYAEIREDIDRVEARRAAGAR